MSAIIVGLDIGTTKIACFIGQKNEQTKKLKILGFAKTSSENWVSRGSVLNILEVSNAIKRVVNEASDMAHVDVSEVYIGIAGQHIGSITNQGNLIIPETHPYILQEDVDKLIEDQYHIMLNPGVEIIHVLPQEFSVDGEVLEPKMTPVGVNGKQLSATVNIVTGNTTNLKALRDSVNNAGYSIKGVVLEPIASAYAVLDEEDRNTGVALVDIGGGTTDIAIFREGIISYTSVLPLAGNTITNDIKQGCHLLKTQAETLKTRFGCCLPENVSENDIITIPSNHGSSHKEISMSMLANIVKARMTEIFEQVDYEIDKANMRDALYNGLVLTGGGSMMRNIKELAEFTTALNTRIGYPSEYTENDTPKDLLQPMYATGIGLLLYGLEQEEKFSSKDTNAKSATPLEDVKTTGLDYESAGISEPEPAPEPVVTPEKKNRYPLQVVVDFLKRIFSEPNIDEKENEDNEENDL